MACGAFSGMMKAAFNVPTFITTLGLFTALRGAANLITGGYPLATFPGWFDFVGNGAVLGLPVPAFVFVAVVLAMHYVMGYTTFGRAVYAVGGNPEAARLSGIKVARVKTATQVLTDRGHHHRRHQPVRRQGAHRGHLRGRGDAEPGDGEAASRVLRSAAGPGGINGRSRRSTAA